MPKTDTSPKTKSSNVALAERLLAEIAKTAAPKYVAIPAHTLEPLEPLLEKRKAAQDALQEWLREFLGSDAKFSVETPNFDAGKGSIGEDSGSQAVWHFGMEVRIPFPCGEFRCLGIVKCDPNGLNPRNPELVYQSVTGDKRIPTLEVLAHFAGDEGVLKPKPPIDRWDR